MRLHNFTIRHSAIVTGLLVVLYCTCGTKLTAPVDDNPYDPANPAFVAPTAGITTAPANGTTIMGDTCRFVWSGNSQSIAFAYRLSSGNWSAWTESTAVTLRNLPEGENIFQLKARDRAGNESAMASVRFSVNFVVGPALLLQPRQLTVPVNTLFQLTVYADEMPDSCVLADLHLEYDRTHLELVSIVQGDFFGKNNGNVLFTQRDTTDTITILTGVTGGTPAWVSGSGKLAVITLKVKASTGLAWVQFSATKPSVLQKSAADLNYGQHSITLTQKINAQIIIP